MPEPTGAYEADYWSFSTYFEKEDGGGYAAGPDLRECRNCGALVGNTDRHDAWHASGDSGASS
jgi:hypothetical protein